MDKVMKKEVRKKQAVIILGLSAFVFLCFMAEVSGRLFSLQREKSEAGTALEYVNAESEKKEQKEKKVAENTKVEVLLNTTNFVSRYHQKVRITSQESFIVKRDGKAKKYKAGECVTFKMTDGSLKKKKIIISPLKGKRLQLLSITRQNRNPQYRGSLQIRWTKKGFLIINRVLLEEYLYAVVPSELSTKNNMEALKAQAICARSYAYRQIKSGRYQTYHADLDDSVDCQVYNNVPEDAKSRKAVKTTHGMVIADKKNRVIQAYYYSTSWGHSASGQDVWDTESEIAYLKEKLQITEESKKKKGVAGINLAKEEEFQSFIQSPEIDTYDSDSEWYRWEVIISGSSLSDRIDSALASCYTANPEHVLTQQEDGSYKVKKLKSVGEIQKLRVEKREKSGLVTELVIVGKKNVVKVCTQYNIRKVLAPVYEKISYNDGKSQVTMSLLPSAAFYIADAGKDNEKAFWIIGGGFGHGTGMSQCGAQKMANSGKTCEEILAHYYDGTKLLKLSEIKK